MSFIYEANYRGFNPSTIHEIFYIMNHYKQKGEKIFREYRSEKDIFDNCAKNICVICRDSKTQEILGFSWCNDFTFSKKHDMLLYSYFVIPRFRKKLSYRVFKTHRCDFAVLTQKNIEEYTNKNNKQYKGLFVITINKRITVNHICKWGRFNYLGKDYRDRNIAYKNFDGSTITNESFLQWKEANRPKN